MADANDATKQADDKPNQQTADYSNNGYSTATGSIPSHHFNTLNQRILNAQTPSMISEKMSFNGRQLMLEKARENYLIQKSRIQVNEDFKDAAISLEQEKLYKLEKYIQEERDRAVKRAEYLQHKQDEADQKYMNAMLRQNYTKNEENVAKQQFK